MKHIERKNQLSESNKESNTSVSHSETPQKEKKKKA